MKVLVTGFDWFGDLVPFIVRALGELGHASEVSFTNRDVLIRRRQAALVARSRAGDFRSDRVKMARQARTRGERIVNENFRRHADRFRPDAILSVLCWGDPCAPMPSRRRGVRRESAG
jgi:hypothetical protein